MIKFKSLNRSKDFVKILKKKKLNTKYFTIYFNKNLNNKEVNYDKSTGSNGSLKRGFARYLL